MIGTHDTTPILVIAAHPDDEVLGCGGTIAAHTAQGHAVHIAILGEGITSRYQQRDQADHAQVQALQARCRAVAALLGAQQVHMYDLPDNRFDTVPLLDIVKLVEELVAQLSPHVIYTHHGGDLNIDHRLVQQAVLTATRPTAGHAVREIYAFEVPSSTEWAFQRIEPAFRPTVFVDIAATLERKIEAMQMYESEARPFPHPRAPEALRATAQRWGSVAGLQAAEALELVRAILRT